MIYQTLVKIYKRMLNEFWKMNKNVYPNIYRFSGYVGKRHYNYYLGIPRLILEEFVHLEDKIM